jgi:hypothetical protein
MIVVIYSYVIALAVERLLFSIEGFGEFTRQLFEISEAI